MTLQEKIQKKAEGFGQLAPVFLEGANFALNNQWINVEDDLPCNHDELKPNSYATYKVIVLLNDGRIRKQARLNILSVKNPTLIIILLTLMILSQIQGILG